jgi:hypothetical protein
MVCFSYRTEKSVIDGAVHIVQAVYRRMTKRLYLTLRFFSGGMECFSVSVIFTAVFSRTITKGRFFRNSKKSLKQPSALSIRIKPRDDMRLT